MDSGELEDFFLGSVDVLLLEFFSKSHGINIAQTGSDCYISDMLSPKIEQSVNEKAAQPAPWNLRRFSQAIRKRKLPGIHLLQRYLKATKTQVVTKYANPSYKDKNVKDYAVADEKYLYCGEVDHRCPTVYTGVDWGSVTDEMVDSFLDNMQIELAEYEVGKALITLASVNQDDTSAERGEKLKEILKKLMPERVEGFIGLAHDLPLGSHGYEMFNIKFELLKHISRI